MVMVLSGAVLFAQTEKSLADKLSLSLEFNASILSVKNDGENVVADSFTDAGFNEDETKIGLAYEDELWGAGASLKFGNENLRFLDGEIGETIGYDFPLALDELYGWIRPFGSRFKFTGGFFENTDGVADYTDDIDHFSMGVFSPGKVDAPYTEPEELTNAALVNGLLSEAAFGPITLQFLLAPNYSEESASDFFEEFVPSISDPSEVRFFRYGGRVIADLGVGTFAALFKTSQRPIALEEKLLGGSLEGTKNTYTTFGGYFDLTAVEGLGVSLGYTGFLPANNGSETDNVLYSGIDLRVAWTGIEGFSISTHNNLSFAKGAEKGWFGLTGEDASFFSLYNALGATKELTDKFSLNAEVSNLFSKIKTQTMPPDYDEIKYNTLGVGAKFIVTVGEYAEFNVGARVDFEKTTGSETTTTFSVPVGIVISF
jgi:hypothetical protein